MVAAGAGLAIGAATTPTYEAKVVLLIGPLNADINTQRSSGALSLTYTQFALSDPIVRDAANKARVPFSAVRSGTRTDAAQTTRLITIQVRNSDAQTAANIANAMALTLIARTQTGVIRPEGQLRVVDPAGKPGKPVAPQLGLIVPLSAAAGLLGALTLVLLIEYLSDTAKTPEEVAELAGVPCLVAIDSKLGRRSSKLIDDSSSVDWINQHRLLATQAELAAKPFRCVLVVGVDEGDGSGTLATNLATIYATRRDRVTLVDAGGGEVTVLTGLSAEPGLSDAVHNPQMPVPVSRAKRPLPFGVVPGGQRGRLEAIRMADAKRIIDELTTNDGVVVVHAAPPLVSSAALVWAQVADVTILAVRRQRAHRRDISESVEHLSTTGANLIGVVLHDTAPVGPPPVTPQAETGEDDRPGRRELGPPQVTGTRK